MQITIDYERSKIYSSRSLDITRYIFHTFVAG